jgi:hypothetical protein
MPFQPMPDQSASIYSDVRAPIGLCASCRHARIVHSSRGSALYLCRLAETDPRFLKYPRLPVLRCAGYEPTEEVEGSSHQQTGIIS